MNEKQIVIEAMKSCGWTQEILADKMGYTAQSCVSSRLRGNSMRVDTFVRFLNEMGYEVVVKSVSPNANKNQWTVSVPDKESSK